MNSKHFNCCYLIVFCFLFLSYDLSASLIQQTFQECVSATSCSTCLHMPDCGWCLRPAFRSLGNVRCLNMSRSEHLECDSKHLYFPSTDIEYELSRPKTSGKSEATNTNEALQLIYPNKVKIKMRPNTEARFKVTFKQPDKYPVDIYYLMDLTWSMKDHLESLVNLADKLVESMSNITTNFRLGFGSFIDKVAMPYSSMLPHKLINPCKENFACVPAYGFRNHLSLTKNTNSFLDQVKRARLSGNLDNAEGGFDAIMQVISCKKEIKWQKMARKIILFATDGIFHYAGDGKLGGIVKPNDGKCHLDNAGYYTESLTQDYPTLNQINKAIVNNQINVIFSVPKAAFRVYEELSQNLIGAVTGELAEDSNNIVELINENYKKIVFTVELKDTSSTNIDLKYSTKCLKADSRSIESNVCHDVGPGQQIEFELSVAIKSCDQYLKDKATSDGKFKEKFVVFAVGIEQYVEVEVELNCQCDCEKEKSIDRSASFCSKNGNLTCGECHCSKEFLGEQCQCSRKQITTITDEQSCTRNGRVCSGRGKCECGRCVCDRKKGTLKSDSDHLVYGRYCELDTFSCPIGTNGHICSANGQCLDSQCSCNDGWDGDACDCSSDNRMCLNPITEKICSGNGECVCGRCKCDRSMNVTRQIYSGRFCSECLNCEDECIEHDACVACKIFDSGPLADNCDEHCKVEINRIDHLDNITIVVDPMNDEHIERRKCIMIDEHNCQYSFIYELDVRTDFKAVHAVPEKQCPKSVVVFRIVSSIVFAVLLIGIILLLVWKVVTFYQDRKAYQQWLDYLQKRQFTAEGENPLYQAPNTKYKNPLYKANDT